MITAEDIDVKSTVGTTKSIGDNIKDARKYLLWVTDILQLAIVGRYEMDWGNNVLLLATFGKHHLLEKYLSVEAGICKPYEEKWKEVVMEWKQFKNDVVENREEINEQMDVSVFRRLERWLGAIEIFGEINEYELLVQEMDTIKLGMLGVERYYAELDMNRKMEEHWATLRKEIEGRVLPSLVSNYEGKILEESNRIWLPDVFWWRKVDWKKVGKRPM